MLLKLKLEVTIMINYLPNIFNIQKLISNINTNPCPDQQVGVINKGM